jgi:hypothetical protein
VEVSIAYEASVLVVANVTADSRELLEAMRQRHQKGPTAFTLLLPKPHQLEAGEAQYRLDLAIDQAREAGLRVTGVIGHADPVIAVSESFDPRKFDEIIVSTLPTGSSRWLAIDLPHRIERITGAPTHHVVATPPRPAVASTPAPEHEPTSPLWSPLRALGWGRRASRGTRTSSTRSEPRSPSPPPPDGPSAA